jgi:DNA-directed RNA polymerase subunit L
MAARLSGGFVTFLPARPFDFTMELRVIEKEDTELSIEVAGEDHTFMNVLKGTLLETEGVMAATYDVNPEQSGGQTDPVLTIKTDDDTDALDALEAGADRVMEKSTDFREAFTAAA